jgi:hypothetical protein
MTLSQDPFGKLVLRTPDGSTHVGIEPVRAFPISDPARQIVLLDPEGREVATVDSIDALDPQSRALLLAELAARDFLPVITHIDRIRGEWFPCAWDVQTDRGATTIQLENEDQIRRVSGAKRVFVTDASGLRFQIPAFESLDAASRRRVERYV